MKRVNIYIESDSVAPRSAIRMAGYILEYQKKTGETVTREYFCKESGTYNAVILKLLVKAVGRINQNCEIHIYSQNQFLLGMIEHNLAKWKENGFRTAKGTFVANYADWREFAVKTQRHLVVTERDKHTYFDWMQNEMRKAAASSKYEKGDTI